ncbi:isoaspartyl peptidase/L-asparaginase [Natronomonas sp. F2-12]|uniref:Plant-type L-asparaginase n=1 Tax=Natronomonas aquatica TaxID=2841590 RepID=A0A9R1CRY4_9EURY|nr:isoaspartyl peptidase/L-asparaginase [Natronomonas aquatica]MCQ4332566.1 isoaspartyl peptidase/L-asparaginase [Natronomonas aquatica]
MRVIVHGGAGTAPADPETRQRALDSAAEAGSEAESPIDAVRTALGALESDPRFNAGRGSAVQSDGYIRTDAGIMREDRSVGAACGMPGVEHAIDVAVVVRSETPHVLVSGVHAVDLADAYGVETDVDLWTDRTRTRWEDLGERPPDGIEAQATWVRERFGGPAERDHDTVGAVATDGERTAAATSTGGRWFALAGRVGDVPQVGSGFYCTGAGGVSATGAGEDIARHTLSRRAVELLEDGHDAGSAARTAIDEFGGLTEGHAGLIVLTPDGKTGADYNSDTMATAVAGELG